VVKQVVAGCVAFIFLFSSFLSPLAEANFWQDRRDHLRKEPPTLLAALPVAGQRPWLPETGSLESFKRLTRAPISGIDRLPGWIASLPASRATLQRVRPGNDPSSAWVVLVQDAHGVPSAQANISDALAFLSQGAGDSLLIGLEGSAGAFNLKDFRPLVAGAYRAVPDVFLRRGLLAGPDHHALTAEKEPLVWGIENPRDYLANVEAYRAGAALKDGFQKEIGAYRAARDARAAAALSPSYKSLDDGLEKFHRGETDLVAHVQALVALGGEALRPGPEVGKLLSVVALEKAVDFKAAEQERAAVLSRLAAALSQEDTARLMARALDLRQGNTTPADFYRELESLAKSYGANLSSFPRFREYLDYLLAADALRPALLYEELDALKAQCLALPADAASRAVLSLGESLRLLDKLARHDMGPDDFRRWTAAKPLLAAQVRAVLGESLPPSFAARAAVFEEFYRAADRRNESLVDNLLNRGREVQASAMVLVAGGYHTPGLEALLAARNVSYVVVTPKVGEIPAEARYLDVFTAKRTPLEELALGDKLFLGDESPQVLRAYLRPGAPAAFRETLRKSRRVMDRRPGGGAAALEQALDAPRAPPRRAAAAWLPFDWYIRKWAHWESRASMLLGLAVGVFIVWHGHLLWGALAVPTAAGVIFWLPHAWRDAWDLLRFEIRAGPGARVAVRNFLHRAWTIAVFIWWLPWRFRRDALFEAKVSDVTDKTIVYSIAMSILFVIELWIASLFADPSRGWTLLAVYGTAALTSLPLVEHVTAYHRRQNFQRYSNDMPFVFDFIGRDDRPLGWLTRLRGRLPDRVGGAVPASPTAGPGRAAITEADLEAIDVYAHGALGTAGKTGGEPFRNKVRREILKNFRRALEATVPLELDDADFRRGEVDERSLQQEAFHTDSPLTLEVLFAWRDIGRNTPHGLTKALNTVMRREDIVDLADRSGIRATGPHHDLWVYANGSALSLSPAERLLLGRAILQAAFPAAMENSLEVKLQAKGRFTTDVVMSRVFWSKRRPKEFSKGGIRWARGARVNPLGLRLALEMVYKDAQDLLMGGAKGLADIDPRLLSKKEKARLMRHQMDLFHEGGMVQIGSFLQDGPAPDIGTTADLMDIATDQDLMRLFQENWLWRAVYYRDLWSRIVKPRLNGRWDPDDTSLLEAFHALDAQGKVRSSHRWVFSHVTGKNPERGGLKGRKEATGLGLVIGVLEILGLMREAAGDPTPVPAQRVAVSGFGNVGSEAALMFHRYGHKVTWVKERNGIIHHPDGLDIPRLMDYWRDHGTFEEFDQEGVEFLPLVPQPMPRSPEEEDGKDVSEAARRFYAAEVDVFAPCAVHYELNRKVAQIIVEAGHVKLIAPGANGPVTPKAEEYLAGRERENPIPTVISIPPDIVLNAGGVTISYGEWAQGGEEVHLPWNQSRTRWELELAMKRKVRQLWATMQALNRERAARGEEPLTLSETAFHIGNMRLTGRWPWPQSLEREYVLTRSRNWRNYARFIKDTGLEAEVLDFGNDIEMRRFEVADAADDLSFRRFEGQARNIFRGRVASVDGENRYVEIDLPLGENDDVFEFARVLGTIGHLYRGVYGDERLVRLEVKPVLPRAGEETRGHRVRLAFYGHGEEDPARGLLALRTLEQAAKEYARDRFGDKVWFGEPSVFRRAAAAVAAPDLWEQAGKMMDHRPDLPFVRDHMPLDWSPESLVALAAIGFIVIWGIGTVRLLAKSIVFIYRRAIPPLFTPPSRPAIHGERGHVTALVLMAAGFSLLLTALVLWAHAVPFLSLLGASALLFAFFGFYVLLFEVVWDVWARGWRDAGRENIYAFLDERRLAFVDEMTSLLGPVNANALGELRVPAGVTKAAIKYKKTLLRPLAKADAGKIKVQGTRRLMKKLQILLARLDERYRTGRWSYRDMDAAALSIALLAKTLDERRGLVAGALPLEIALRPDIEALLSLGRGERSRRRAHERYEAHLKDLADVEAADLDDGENVTVFPVAPELGDGAAREVAGLIAGRLRPASEDEDPAAPVAPVVVVADGEAEASIRAALDALGLPPDWEARVRFVAREDSGLLVLRDVFARAGLGQDVLRTLAGVYVTPEFDATLSGIDDQGLPPNLEGEVDIVFFLNGMPFAMPLRAIEDFTKLMGLIQQFA